MPGVQKRSEDPAERIREIEAMLAAITAFEVTMLDMSGRIASWSAGGEALTGYTAAEVLGQPASMFYADDDRPEIERRLRTAQDVGRSEFQGWRWRKDGDKYWAGVVLAPVRRDTGELTGFVSVTRDETERRDIEERQQRQRDEILELSTPVVQVWDDVLVLPIIGTLDSRRAARLTEGLLATIAETQAKVIILEVTGVPTIDSVLAQHLLNTVRAVALMGTVSILSGVRAEVAQSMVNLGVDLGQLRSRSTLRDALQLALRLLEDQPSTPGSGHPGGDDAERFGLGHSTERPSWPGGV
ncbi:PAS domain S-box protein [Actinopolymorpha sp. B17G11]|uniref:PAS domain S-box protein n=1 Tax=unclassified Actinopolymorpha TaxID=2627063 RepID=UPI0032D8EEE5